MDGWPRAVHAAESVFVSPLCSLSYLPSKHVRFSRTRKTPRRRVDGNVCHAPWRRPRRVVRRGRPDRHRNPPMPFGSHVLRRPGVLRGSSPSRSAFAPSASFFQIRCRRGFEAEEWNWKESLRSRTTSGVPISHVDYLPDLDAVCVVAGRDVFLCPKGASAESALEMRQAAPVCFVGYAGEARTLVVLTDATVREFPRETSLSKVTLL